MNTSQTFREKFETILNEYRTLQSELDARMSRTIDELQRTEEELIASQCAPPYSVGTRVKCSGYRREGTIVAARPHVIVRNDDYYAPSCGPDQYSLPDEDCFETQVSWEYTVETDPSPVKRSVATFVIHNDNVALSTEATE